MNNVVDYTPNSAASMLDNAAFLVSLRRNDKVVIGQLVKGEIEYEVANQTIELFI